MNVLVFVLPARRWYESLDLFPEIEGGKHRQYYFFLTNNCLDEKE